MHVPGVFAIVEIDRRAPQGLALFVDEVGCAYDDWAVDSDGSACQPVKGSRLAGENADSGGSGHRGARIDGFDRTALE